MKARKQPQLSEQDKAFALEVHNRYKLPVDDLCRLITGVRNNLVDDWEELNQSSDYVQSFSKLFDPEVEITAVNIVTNKGTIEIASSDTMYSYLKIPIQRIKDKFKANLNYLETAFARGGKYYSSEQVMKFINATSLKPRHKEILAFEFIHYFKFFPGKPTMTEQEWAVSSIEGKNEAKNYSDYCRDIGKSRLQNIK